jgi:hypothetical protein
MGICKVEGCGNETYATGERVKRVVNNDALIYCRKHCQWLQKYGSLEPPKYSQGSIEFRFWKHVEKRGEDDCWGWKGDVSRSGYGSVWHKKTNRNISAHRFSYELHHGVIAEGMQIMHSCDNKKCVNPAHLSQGTPKQNTREAVERGLRKPIPVKTGENNPKSKLTLEQARYIKKHPEIKLSDLASMFGVSPNCIRGVRIGRTWKEA